MDKEPFRVRVAGIKYPNDDGSDRESIIRRCEEGEILVLKHTPVPQDKNAVRILRDNGEQLGWLPREYTRYIAYYLDRGIKMEASFKSLYHSVNGPISADIFITRPEEEMPTSSQNDTILQSLKRCGVCGASIDAKAKKCPACGKSICVNCGNPIGSGVTKCPKCGESTALGGIQALGFLLFIIGFIIIFIFIYFTMC
jgi:hypothetical protein